MAEIFRVVVREDGGEWRPVDTKKRLYFTAGTAKAVASGLRREQENRDRVMKRRAEYAGKEYTPKRVEFKIQRAELGEWEDLDG